MNEHNRLDGPATSFAAAALLTINSMLTIDFAFKLVGLGCLLMGSFITYRRYKWEEQDRKIRDQRGESAQRFAWEGQTHRDERRASDDKHDQHMSKP